MRIGLPRITYPIAFSGCTCSVEELGIIQSLGADCAGPRTQLAYTRCELLDWRRPAGTLKTHEGRHLLEHLAAKGLLAVPPDTNRAERGLRTTVIVRKMGFDSQSGAEAKTREILMRVLHTLRKRGHDAQTHFKWLLDQLATHPSAIPSRSSSPATRTERRRQSLQDLAPRRARLRVCATPRIPFMPSATRD